MQCPFHVILSFTHKRKSQLTVTFLRTHLAALAGHLYGLVAVQLLAIVLNAAAL